MKRHALKVGEYYAIKPSAIERDADGFFVLVGDSVPENETHGTVVIVHIRGALCQFKGDGGDSYEAIAERVCCAFASDPKPSAVVLSISSPGGLVAGLNETVFKLQRASKECGIPLVAYVNELAASAAFALACACEERLAPESGIAGSIGTISTMVSQSRKDAADGLDFRIITSGKRKSDGHPHVEISDDAVKAEKVRNAMLASQFFELAGKALGMSPARLEALEASIYVGQSAKKVGLVDDIMSIDDALYGLDKAETPAPTPAPNTGNITDRRAKELDKPSATMSIHKYQGVTKNVRPGGTMPVKLDALIKKTEAAITVESDPRKLRSLQANLSAFLATRSEMDDDDDDDDKKKDDDGDDESKAEKAAKKAEEAKKTAEAAKHRARSAEFKKKAEEAEEAAKKAEGDDEEEAKHAEDEAKAVLSPGAAAAIASQAKIASDTLSRLEVLEKSAAARDLAGMIEGALLKRRITKPEAKMLAAKSGSFVKDFLDMRPHAVIVTDESALPIPAVDAKGNTVLPADVEKAIAEAMVVAGEGKTADQKASIRASMVDAHTKRMNGSAPAGRY